MYRYWLLLYLLCAGSLSESLHAQVHSKYQMAELTLAAGQKQFSGALSYHKSTGVALKKRLRIGYGLRATGFHGKNQELITAPARLTTGVEGPQVIFLPTKPDNLDTIQTTNSSVVYFNALFVIEYGINEHFDIGFNIDLAGFTLGSSQTVTYQSGKNKAGDFPEKLQAEPSPWNLLLISHNDIGSLNSEIYLRYLFNQNWAIKLAYAYQFIEYTTSQKLRLENDRFRQTPGLIALGLSYKFKQIF